MRGCSPRRERTVGWAPVVVRKVGEVLRLCTDVADGPVGFANILNIESEKREKRLYNFCDEHLEHLSCNLLTCN